MGVTILARPLGSGEGFVDGADERTALLVRHSRAGLWILLLAIMLFGSKALVFDRTAIIPLAVLKGIQLATVLAMFWLLRASRRWRWCVPAALVVVSEVSITTAVSGILIRDVGTTYLLFIVLATATGTFLPWGVRPQLGAVGVAAVAALYNTWAVGAPLAAVASPLVAMVLAFCASVYVAWDAERYHRERKRAEEALAAAQSRSEAEAEVFAALARVGREMMSLLDTPTILDRLCRVTTEVLGCDRSHTWLWKPEEDAYVPVAGHGDLPGHGQSLGGVKVPRASIGGLLAQLEREDLARGGTGMRPASCAAPASMQVPLRRGEEIIGIHTAGYREHTQPFTLPQQCIMRGITHLASLALANARLVEQLQHANQLKSDFVSTMSHELRTPLHVILGYADMADDDGLEATRRKESVAHIRAAGRELLELIDGTLEIGKIEAGQDEPRLETVPLAAFWAELGARCARLPCKPEVALEWSPEVPPIAIRTDHQKLTVVVRNLVGNALKFTERGRVRVEVSLADRDLVLRVADTGIGIRPEDQQLIFEMFRQADGSDSRRYSGAGLGLYIVRRFVEQIGGRLALESTPRCGSVFTVTLPAPAA